MGSPLSEAPTVAIPPLSTSQPKAEQCEEGHPVLNIGIQCAMPTCRRFIILDQEVYRGRKRVTFLASSLIVLAALGAVMLSRYAGHLWPLYAFVVLGVMLLYASVFSRGLTIEAAAWTLTATVIGWSVWYLLSRGFNVSLGEGRGIDLAILLLAVIGWMAFVALICYLGFKHGLSTIRRTSVYFLTVGAMTFGYFGVWLLLLENGLANLLLLRAAVGLGVLLPLACAGLHLWLSFILNPPAESRPWTRWSLLLVVLGAYLVLLEPLIRALTFLLGQFIPLIVGQAPLPDAAQGIPGGPPWRALATSILLTIAVTLVAVQSFLQVTADEASTNTFGGSPQVNEELKSSPGDILGETAKDKFQEAGYTGTYYGKIGLAIIENILHTARGLINVAIPVAMFGILSAFIVLVLGTFQDHRQHGPFFSPISLWGTGLTTWIIVVILCGIAYEFAQDRLRKDVPPQTKPEERKPPLRLLAETGAAALLGGLLYFLVSMVSVALLPLWLNPQDSSATFDGFVPGQIYFVNLIVSMGALLILVALAYAYRSWIRERLKIKRSYAYGLAAVVLIALSTAAVSFATPPIQAALTYVGTPHDAAALPTLRGQIPAGLTPAACAGENLLLGGAQSGLACTTGDRSVDVYYHQFVSTDQLRHWYGQATAHRGIAAGQGACDGVATGEGSYARGRVACRDDRGVAWLIWTDESLRILGIARSATHSSTALYGIWDNGTFSGRGAPA